jgi:hypothetical protein
MRAGLPRAKALRERWWAFPNRACRSILRAIGSAALLWCAAGCEGEPAVESPPPDTARQQRLEDLRALRDRVRHPADGTGRAWLERQAGQLPYATSATPDHFEIVFEAGPLGIASGGSILFQLPQIGGWSIPQTTRPNARGYTLIESDSADVELDLASEGQSDERPGGTKSLAIRFAAQPLRAGERVRIRYGAGRALALPDRYAESEARFWIGVDGDGDGSYSYLKDSPTIEVRAGRPDQLLASVSSTASPGEPARVTLSLIDAHRNAATAPDARVALRSIPEGLQFPALVELASGSTHFEVIPPGVGVYRIVAAAGQFRATSNPLVVTEDATPIFWGDLHGHSGFSDGTGNPEEYFRYARDTAGLDVAAITDHDHLGVLPLDASPERWERTGQITRLFHQPDRFVALRGFEWTNWIYGHRHVLYFDSSGELLSAMNPSTETPTLLWGALRRGRASALTFAHHSAGGPIATDWSIPPDPHFEPVTEITSIHGSSEAPDAAVVIKNPVVGNFVRDALGRGYRLGFVGSGDTHDGHPGVTHVGYASGGLAAIAAEQLTRESILDALRARRVYATSGSRIVLLAHLNGKPMGSTFHLGETDSRAAQLRVSVFGTQPIKHVDLVGASGPIETIAGDGNTELHFERTRLEMRPGEYLYVRVVQSDDATAWSSPFFFEEN